MACQILRAQTTFWDVSADSEVRRISFIGKEEWHLDGKRAESFAILDQHPLSLDYTEPWADIFISGAHSDPVTVVEELCHVIDATLAGWRAPQTYLTKTGPDRMLREGFGMLLSAPHPIAAAASLRLAGAGIPHNVLSTRHASGPHRVLLIGRSYVIARDFRVAAPSPN